MDRLSDAVRNLDLSEIREVFRWNPRLNPTADMLEFAVSDNYFDMAQLLLTRPRHVNAKFDNDQTLLHYAKTAPMVELLLASGIAWDVQTRDEKHTALHFAVSENNLDIVRILVQPQYRALTLIPDVYGNIPLHYSRNRIAVNILLDAEPNSVEIHNKNGQTPLITIMLSSNNLPNATIAIISAGADLSYIGEYADHFPFDVKPIAYGYLRLLSASEHQSNPQEHDDVDVKTVADVLGDFPWLVNTRFGDFTMLSNALRNGREAVVRAMIAHGARPDLQSIVTKTTAVHIAADFGDLWFVREFASLTDLEMPRIDGTRAVHYACFQNDMEMLQLLLERGVDTLYTNDQGWTPLMLAVNNGNLAMTRSLLEYQSPQTSLGFAIEIAEEMHMPQTFIELLYRYRLSSAAGAGNKI